METPAKQQVVERLKQATNVLVTVSNNPSVDQLAACIGLTLLLNKMGKHATAVFSGQVPSTIEFLKPQDTIEKNTDSLRDFIIALDKSKADKLRYKVEDQVVKIFITPYRTSLSEKDLVFSQGDFNVDAVMALGIKDRTQLDAAITQHGRILHDATVIAVNTGDAKIKGIGQINWTEATASSLSEMLVSITEAFGPNLIDGQMATAFLTGIVAETERFSNTKTSPKVMTMSAQLMAAGANQQLIVEKLQPPPPPPPQAPKPAVKTAAQPKAAPPAPQPPKEPPKPDGTLNVAHGKDAQVVEEVDINPNEIHIDKEGNLKTQEEVAATPSAPQTPQPPAPAQPAPPPVPVPEAPAPEMPAAEPPPSDMATGSTSPHSLLMNQGPVMEAPFSATTSPVREDDTPVDPLADEAPHEEGFINHAEGVQPPHVDQARNSVEAALAGSPDTAPVQNLNAQFMADNLHPAEPSQQSAPSQPPAQMDMAPPAPPPFAPPPNVPPPITTPQGVVIPPPYTPSNSADNTL
jgi:hypothetical protein